MTYGILLKNKFGDRVLNSGGLLFEQSSGSMVFVDSRHLASGGEPFMIVDQLDVTARKVDPLVAKDVTMISAGTKYYPTTKRPIYNDTDGGSFDKDDYNAGSTMQVYSNNYVVSYQPRSSQYSNKQDYNRVRHAIPNTDDLSLEYEVFFKIPDEGLHNWAESYNPYDNLFDTNCKGVHIFATASHLYTSGINYVVATTKKPSVSSDQSGMQIFNEDGSVRFDSRYQDKTLTIKDYIRITASQFQDCIENGTTYDFTLRQPINNAYVGGGVQGNFKNQSGGSTHYMWRPTFKMTSPTNLRMYRTQYRYSSPGELRSGLFYNYNDCLITILDY
jgi:hypothetical protein